MRKKNDSYYLEILNNELKDSRLILNEEIEMQNDFIESKISDYPFLKPSFQELNDLKNELKTFKMNSQKQNDERNLSEFIKKVNTNYKIKFEFNSIKTNLTDSLYFKVLENDLLKAEYLLNKTFIEKHCNFVE
jgi:hypothetical protein